MTRYDVCSPIYLTTEPNERVFGEWHGEVHETSTMEWVQIEQKRNKQVNTVFKSYIQVTRKVEHGYDTLFDVFFKTGIGMSTLLVVPFNLSFEGDDDPVVAQLWNALNPTIEHQVAQVRTLLSRFNVPEDSRYPFLRKFDTIKDLVQVYMAENSENGEYDPQDDPPRDDATNGSSGGANLDLLSEAIIIVTESDSDADADADTDADADADANADADADAYADADADSYAYASAFAYLYAYDFVYDC